MNQDYTTVSVTANIIQAVTQVLGKLDRENIEVPDNLQEVANDIQACAAKHIGGANVI